MAYSSLRSPYNGVLPPSYIAVIKDMTDATDNNLALTGAGGGYAGTFSAVGNLVNARSNHTATLLGSGDVLVAGGIGTAGAAIHPPLLQRLSSGDSYF